MKFSIRAASAVGAVGVLALAGCAGSGEQAAPTAGETGAPTGAAAADLPEEIVLGLVPSQDLDQLVTDGEALGEQLSAELGVPVTTTVTDSYAALVVAMQTGQAHIGMFGPIALVQAMDQAGAVPVLQSERYGSSTYVTQWFTADAERFCEDEPVMVDKDGIDYSYCNGTDATMEGPLGESSLAAIEEGDAISFVDEGSASGYYYPATQLQAAGLDPFTQIEGIFAGGHPNSVLTVLRGDAVVGVSFNDAREDVVEEDPEAANLTVFAYSTNIPNDGIAVSGDLSEEARAQITDAFLALAASEEGLAALDAVYGIEGLVPADLDALDAARQVEQNFGDAE